MSLVPSATVTVAGVRHTLCAGNIVGRGDVHLVIAHPDVSEAHALCSLRESGLVLLRLRGPLLVREEEHDEVLLQPGLVIGLADDVELSVEELHLPARVLALTDGRATVPLRARYARFGVDPLGLEPDGPLEVWSRGAELWAAFGGHTLQLAVGVRLGPVHVVSVPAGNLATADTRRTGPLVDFTANPVVVHTDQPHTFNVLTARLLEALAVYPDAVHWPRLAARMWPREDPELRRKDFENAWMRATRELQAAHAPDLVKRTGRGYYCLNRERYRVRV